MNFEAANRPKGVKVNVSKIEWLWPPGRVGRTWNPFFGCDHNCEFGCYAEKMARRFWWCKRCQRFEVHEHHERLLEDGPRSPAVIFIGSMSDPACHRPGYIAGVVDWVREHRWHTCIMLTKRPDQINLLDVLKGNVGSGGWPTNLWFGASVTCQDDVWRIKELANQMVEKRLVYGRLVVSFEPLLGPIDVSTFLGLEWSEAGDCWLDNQVWAMSGQPRAIAWGIIGPLSGNKALRPDSGKEGLWARALITQFLEAKVPVFVKTKPARFKGVPVIQEWPKAMIIEEAA